MAEANGRDDGFQMVVILTMDPWNAFRLCAGDEDSGFKS